MTAPSQTPEAAGLVAERIALIIKANVSTGEGRHWGVDSAVEAILKVTAASAQAAIDAEKAKVAELEERIAYLRGSRDGHAAHAHSEFEARVAAEARADRLAEIASKLDAAIGWLDYPFIDNRTPEAELRQRVGFMMKDAEPHRTALQQETQK